MSLSNLQMGALGATVVAQGTWWAKTSYFIETNNVALMFFLSVATGLIFCFAAMWNALSNHRLKNMNKRMMIEDVINDMRSGGASQESIDTFIYYARKRK